MDTFNNLPLYKIKFNPDDESVEGIDLISFVKDPAIMRKGIKLSADFKFAVDNEKMIVVAPALIPDLPIFRRDMTGEEYYITFTKDTIEGLVKKFNKNIKTQSLNIDHTQEIAPAYILESWIKEDDVYDKSVKYGFTDVPIGSWFISAQITDKSFWDNAVKQDGKFGFSIEGFLDLELSKHFNLDKISFDFDDTLTKPKWRNLAKTLIDKGDQVWIITRRQHTNSSAVYQVADMLGIPHSRVVFTDGKLKWEAVKKYGIQKHYDNNQNEIDHINALTTARGIIALVDMTLEIIEGYVASANVDEYRYNDVNNTLILTFHDGSKYKYFGIDRETFDSIVLGDASCETAGENEFGRWWVGKTPSVGAAVWEYLIRTNIRYEKLTALNQPCNDCFIEVNPGETEQEYISRCMASNKMNDEFPDESQRAAVCYSKWKSSMNKLSEINIYEKNKTNEMKKYAFELVGKLMDGTAIYIEPAFEVGAEVKVLDENGNKVPVFDAEHELADGTVVVTVDGKITEIKPKMEDTAVEPQPETELEEVKVEYITKEEFNAFVELFNTFKNEFSKEIFEAMIETKINGLTKVEEATKTEQFNKVEEPKDYKSFILSRIEMIK